MAKTKIARRPSGNGKGIASNGSNTYRRRIEQLQTTSKRTAQRVRAEAEKQEEVIASAAAAYLLGHAKKKAWKLPTLGNMEPALLYGAGLAFAGPHLLSGRAGRLVQAAGSGLLTVGAYTYARTGDSHLSGVQPPPQRPNGFYHDPDQEEVELDE